jgi:hypothetical protein
MRTSSSQAEGAEREFQAATLGLEGQKGRVTGVRGARSFFDQIETLWSAVTGRFIRPVPIGKAKAFQTSGIGRINRPMTARDWLDVNQNLLLAYRRSLS